MGTYTGTGNKNLTWSSPKHITVRSENGANNCIIDCENSGRGFCLLRKTELWYIYKKIRKKEVIYVYRGYKKGDSGLDYT